MEKDIIFSWKAHSTYLYFAVNDIKIHKMLISSVGISVEHKLS